MNNEHIFDILKKQPTPTQAFARIRYRYDYIEHTIYHNLSHGNTEIVHMTVSEFIEKIFPLFPLQTTHIDLNDFLSDLGLQRLDGAKTLDDLFKFIEFIWYAIDATPSELLNSTISQYNNHHHIYHNIEKAITLTLKQLGYKETTINDGRIVVKQDFKIEQAKRAIEDRDYIELLTTYNHFTNNGNLMSKQSILKQLGDYIEPTLQERNEHKDTCWHKTAETVSNLLNNFHIRHNNKNGTYKREYISKMDDNTIEAWYDKTYNLIIQLLIELENEKIPKEIKSLQS